MRTPTRWSTAAVSLAVSLSAATAYAQALVKGMKEPIVFKVSSPAFADKAPIPKKYTCDGEGVRPPLQWSDLPAGTAYLLVTIDYGSSRKSFWSQWVAYDIPATLPGLGEGTPLPAGAFEGTSDWGKPGYDPPCPKPGKARDYLITVYALKKPMPDLGRDATRSTVLNASDGKVLGWGRLFFTYEREQRAPQG